AGTDRVVLFDAAPSAPIALQQLVGFAWSPGARWVVGEAARRQRVPDVKDGLDYGPTRFDHICALEQRGIADHAVAQEPFVSGGVFDTEVAGIIEIHVDESELHDRAWNLCSKTQCDAFVRLNVDEEPIRFDIFDGSVAKEHKGSSAELNDDFRGALGEALSCAQIKRNTSPAPIVNAQLQ